MKQVVSELTTQRESLLRTRDRLQNTNEELSKSRRILRIMKTNVLYNKCILIVIILLEICILGGLIFIKFIKK